MLDQEQWAEYLHLVKRHANRLRKRTKLSYDDLFQAGCVGLLEALEKLRDDFVPSQKSRFIETYVWHNILKVIRELQHPVYIPLHLNRRINNQEVTFSSVSSDNLDFDETPKNFKDVCRSGSNGTSYHIDILTCTHYRLILQRSLEYLVNTREIDDVELVCFVLFHGLFDSPKFCVEDISRIMSISSNTVSKKTLKTMRLLKEVVPKFYDLESVFGQ